MIGADGLRPELFVTFLLSVRPVIVQNGVLNQPIRSMETYDGMQRPGGEIWSHNL